MHHLTPVPAEGSHGLMMETISIGSGELADARRTDASIPLAKEPLGQQPVSL
jgi:hypothetical protein